MSLTSKILTSVLVTGALLFPTSAQAMFMEQSQDLSQEFKIEGSSSSNGSSSTSFHAKVSQSGSQSQRMSDTTDWSGWHDETPDRDGEVRLTWPARDGVCHVRYTEATSRSYKYSTSAACSDGGVTIGGLVPGKNYRFQVKVDNGSWGRTRTLRAS